MKAMILAAGLGTRLFPITQSKPKALIEVNKRPQLEHIILKLKEAGFTQIIINIHHFSELILNFLSEKKYFGIDILISDETHQLLDTGGALKQAGHLFDIKESLLVHNVDILSNIDLQLLFQEHQKDENHRISTLFVSEKKTERYLLFDKNNQLKGWTNIKTKEIKPTQLIDISKLHKKAFSGVQIVSPRIFELMKNENNRFSIIDFYMKICTTENIVAYQSPQTQILDIGKPHTIKKASSFLRTIKQPYNLSSIRQLF